MIGVGPGAVDRGFVTGPYLRVIEGDVPQRDEGEHDGDHRGKRHGRHSVSQETINKLLVQKTAFTITDFELSVRSRNALKKMKALFAA